MTLGNVCRTGDAIYRLKNSLVHKGAEIIHETGCFAIVQGPLAQLSPRVCPTACWAIGKQLVSQINLMMVSCVLNTPNEMVRPSLQLNLKWFSLKRKVPNE
ncbi:hypothetical protein CWO07_26635 [Vibrio splendidus]|uniref:Uncharacterized protein n=1 Tax=Vibrio splendidus TaxID=29497 RepID=A0A2N7CGY0_VIBSP|nr:hypothetical protein A150_15980 [Vibrio splendidus 1S-124]PMF23264.1 hypothetical protein BCV19_04380 [Vibrio splendidus]PMI75420.1 hypothetical protein BCU38_10665 [Vibrio splendidus]PMO41644.1 hypothetical protein BCT10_18960 [Vibrio splendidus]PTP12225.1 hypothetical protein CWO07_26635 [Vibrio splendidus]